MTATTATCDSKLWNVWTHLVDGQVQGPKAEKHHAVSESLHQHGGEAQCSADKTQQLHRGVRVQAELRSQPQQGGRGQQQLPERLTTVSLLQTRRQQPVVTIET